MYIPEETIHHEGWTILGQFKETNGIKQRNKKYKECKNDEVGLRLGFKLQDKGLILFRETCYIKKNQNKLPVTLPKNDKYKKFAVPTSFSTAFPMKYKPNKFIIK